jgi:predicted nucleic acid-binding protein
MWLAVSDTSPINYLLQIGEIEALERLYGRVVLPSAVVSELLHQGSPAVVRHWAARPPKWVEVRTPVGDPVGVQTNFGAGERATILLGAEMRADVLLMDDRAGVAEAKIRGLAATGTLGVLRSAHDLGLLDLKQATDRLLKTNFRIRRTTMEAFVRRWLEPPERPPHLVR